MSQPSHIFIVGLPRTATTLTRMMLNSSDYVGLGGESMFFGDRRWLGLARREGYRQKFTRAGDLKGDTGLAQVVDYIYAIQQDNFWSKTARRIDRQDYAVRVHQDYERRYPGQHYLSKYEDLILAPEESLQKICRFLDIPFETAMLDQLVPNSSFVPERLRTGIDSSGIDR